MDLLPTLVNAFVVVFVASIGGWLLKERLDRIDHRLDRFEDRVERRFEQTERRFEQMERRFEQIGADIAALRADLTQIALAVGARTRPQTG